MNRLNIRFVIQQGVVFLLLGYLALIGGTDSGVMFYLSRLLNVLFIALAVIPWWISWATRGFPFPRTRLDLAWLVFVLTQLVATVCSIDPRRGVTPLTLTLLYWLAFYLAVDLLRRCGFKELLVSTLLLLSALLIVVGLIQLVGWYHSWWEIGGREHLLPPATLRIRSIIPHANLLAAYVNVLLPFGVAAWIEKKGRLARAVLVAWAVLMLALLFFTSSRGGWLGTAAALAALVLLFMLDRRAWVADRWRRLCRHPATVGLLGLLMAGVLAAGILLLVRQAQHPTHGALFTSRQWLWAPVWMTTARFPLWGSGPATYATQAMQISSIPPVSLYIHAHSFPLNTLLESGLLGTLALGGLVFAVVRSALLQWRSAPPGARSWLIAALAALAATFVHSQFDMPQMMPGFSLLVVLALALIESTSSPAPRRVWVERSSRVALGMAWPVLIGALVVGLVRYADYARGIELTNTGEYEAAAPILDRVAVRDPALATNWFQAGYVHATLGWQEDGTAHLRQAVEEYRAGLSLEPDYAINWVNLGVLLWRVGDEEGARAALEEAVERASQEAAFALTLGAFEEGAGSPTRAAELYRQGLELRPEWADSYFFRATSLRAAVREQWLAGWRAPVEPLAGCWAALRAGEPDEARRCFAGARVLNDPAPYYGLGLTERAAGDLAEAEWDLRVAAWIGSGEAELALGDVLAQQGDLAGAVRQYERELGTPGRPNDVNNVTAYYTWSVFNREAIVDRFLPGAVWVSVTDDVAERMLQLGAWYEQLGRTEDAARTYRNLLEAVPDMAAAGERLRVLESQSTD